jgi:hypothetical protein
MGIVNRAIAELDEIKIESRRKRQSIRRINNIGCRCPTPLAA